MSGMWAQVSQPQFWIAALQIIWINILLSGDNAVVIAMACRDLPPRQRRWGMIIGAGVSSTLLIVFTSVVTALMALPYLRLISACALLWIAIKLVAPAPHDGEEAVAVRSLRRAVRIIVVADIVMSLDNVVAVAAVAQGRYVLLGLSLAVSIPVVYGGSAIVMSLIGRFPIIVWAGGALLGFVAGELFVGDPAVASHLSAAALVDIDINFAISEAARHFKHQFSLDLADMAFGTLGACLVILVGLLWRRRTTEDGRRTTDDRRQTTERD
jgi:YjbE family integral membrane protein